MLSMHSLGAPFDVSTIPPTLILCFLTIHTIRAHKLDRGIKQQNVSKPEAQAPASANIRLCRSLNSAKQHDTIRN